MKSLLLAGAALAATIAAASAAAAADLARPIFKAPPAAAPAAGWTGFYLGVNAGYGTGRNPTCIGEYSPFPTVNNFSTTKLSPAGFIGGGQVGYKWQWTPSWVVGVETDFQGSLQKDTSCSFVCFSDQINTSQKLTWFGTTRGVLGWAQGSHLWYVTGGLAYGKVRSESEEFEVDLESPPNGAVVTSGRALAIKTGWTVGGGVETRLWNSNWSAKLEYLYMDLGRTSYDLIATALSPDAGAIAERV